MNVVFRKISFQFHLKVFLFVFVLFLLLLCCSFFNLLTYVQDEILDSYVNQESMLYYHSVVLS